MHICPLDDYGNDIVYVRGLNLENERGLNLENERGLNLEKESWGSPKLRRALK